MLLFDSKAHLFSSSYVWYGVQQSMNRTTLHFGTICHIFIFFSAYRTQRLLDFFFIGK